MRAWKVIRVAASGMLALGIVGGGLGLGLPDEPKVRAAAPLAPLYADDEMPAYPNALEYPLSESGLTFNGLSMRISHFTTSDDAQRVRDFYVDAFAGLGAQTRIFPTTDGGFSLSAWVGAGSNQAVVVISPRGKITEVFPAVVPVNAALETSKVADEDIPFSRGAVGISRVGDRQADGVEMVTYLEPLMKAAEAATFTGEQLAARGWALTERTVRPDGTAAVEAQKGPRVVRLDFTPFTSEPRGVNVVARYSDAAQGAER